MSGERVVPPAKADVKDFERRLSATAVTHDAADFGVVARPRLWWTRVAWQSLSNQADAPVKLKWSTHQGLPRVHFVVGRFTCFARNSCTRQQ